MGTRNKGIPHRDRRPICWYPKVRPDGYVHGVVRENGETRRMVQHRWVIEQHLGRRLTRAEDVHHINGIKHDNRLENLRLMDHVEHTRITKSHLAIQKVTPEVAAAIRAEYGTPSGKGIHRKVSHGSLGRKYGISRSAVGDIVRGERAYLP